jgi:cob(I)alamin adenosyltransferase
MKIYTKTGDRGDTSLFGGGRVRKDDPRVEAYGAVDELNSFVGALGASLGLAQNPEFRDTSYLLTQIQNRLFDLGAELATGDAEFLRKLPRRIADADIEILEIQIDRMETQLPPLKNFILPGGAVAAAHAHICRSVSRRAERAMLGADTCPPEGLRYINRLSDFFFVLARHINRLTGITEPEWEK